MRTGRRWGGLMLAALIAAAALGGCTPESIDPDGALDDCWTCHGDRYQTATAPDHAGLGYPKDCTLCHDLTGWRPAQVTAHGPDGVFPLTGAHAQVACSECHGDPLGQAAGTACADCHLADYQATTNPDHQAQGYPTDCTRCHGTDAWRPAETLAHQAGGSFPLTGAHATAACSACHGDPLGDPAGTACADCHLADYQATSDPNHSAQGYPTDCTQCHSTTAWRPAAATAHTAGGSFPLTGAHTEASCSDCHGDPLGDPAGTACVDCHQADYLATDNPDHQSLGLPGNCDRCHTTSGWSPASFDGYHDFPLSTGRHTGLACSACHPDGNLWADFDCLGCHEHSRALMDEHHLGEVAGYAYNSPACYSCHPNGLAGGD